VAAVTMTIAVITGAAYRVGAGRRRRDPVVM
jgi:hypothetical protein